MPDNATAHLSNQYDTQIHATIPYYTCFHDEIINFVQAAHPDPRLWLDTGCGTASFAEKVLETFSDVQLLLADPSPEMIAVAKQKISAGKSSRVIWLEPVPTQNLVLPKDCSPDIITAVQSHHYLSLEKRTSATRVCYDILSKNGIFITFENIRPSTAEATNHGLAYWKQFQIKCGKTETDAENHINRFGTEYFPITIAEHRELYASCGFKTVELFWYSYMQAGFYCIK